MKEPKLTIELVPETCWYANLRSELKRSDWDKLRKKTFEAAGNVCEICGGVGRKFPVECHEIWEYDDSNKVQTLKGTVALCPSCHEVKHIGLAGIRGFHNRAVRHLAKINGWTIHEASDYVNAQKRVWRERSNHSWKCDHTWVDNQIGELK